MSGYDLSEQIVLVAGASSGMGRATALAAAAAGARVILAARNESALSDLRSTIQQRGGSVLAIPADLTNRAAADNLISSTLNEYGHIDTIVNSVGTNIPRRTIDELTPASWTEMIAINLDAAFNLTQASVPILRQQGGGLLIYISSSAAKSQIAPVSPIRLAKPVWLVSLTVQWKRNAHTAFVLPSSFQG